MISQRYQERIAIERLTGAKDAAGAQTQTWAAFATRSGRSVPRQSQRYERLASQFTVMTAAYDIRGRVAVTPRMRISHLGRYFEVIGVLTADGRPPALCDDVTLICQGLQ